jgi:hypothetical protein
MKPKPPFSSNPRRGHSAMVARDATFFTAFRLLWFIESKHLECGATYGPALRL